MVSVVPTIRQVPARSGAGRTCVRGTCKGGGYSGNNATAAREDAHRCAIRITITDESRRSYPQNRSLRANWTCREVLEVAVICPAVPLTLLAEQAT